MEITYSLDESDYLAYQLFYASKSARVKQNRNSEMIWLGVAFLIIAIIIYQNGNNFMGTYFLIATVLVVVFYPRYSRWRYQGYYLKHIREVYKDSLGQPCMVRFTESQIEMAGTGTESKINLSQVKEINETGEYFFLQLLSGHAIVIPKKKVSNIADVTEKIKEIGRQLNIVHNVDINWKWK